MKTEIAQAIALASYGNEYLLRGHLPPNFYPANSVFQFCNRVEFYNFEKSLFSSEYKSKICANNPAEWYELMKKEGCTQIRLYYKPDTPAEVTAPHMRAGFIGGGGLWLVETVFGRYSHFWGTKWEVTDREAADKKIWTVNYGRRVLNQYIAATQFDLVQLRHQLAGVLADIAQFATREKLESWADIFNKAKMLLTHPAPETQYYHPDLIVTDNYPLETRQLLFAAGAAWVFGGMGSWNDMGFEDEETGNRLTARLYELVNQVYVGAVNSF